MVGEGFARGQRVHRDPGGRAPDLRDTSNRPGAWSKDHHEESGTDRHDVQQERVQAAKGLASTTRAAVHSDKRQAW